MVSRTEVQRFRNTLKPALRVPCVAFVYRPVRVDGTSSRKLTSPGNLACHCKSSRAGVGADAAWGVGFGRLYGRFRCPDGRIVRLGRTHFYTAGQTAGLCAGEPLVCRRRRRAVVQPRSSGAGSCAKRQEGGGTGVEHPERLHTRAETKGERAEFRIQKQCFAWTR